MGNMIFSIIFTYSDNYWFDRDKESWVGIEWNVCIDVIWTAIAPSYAIRNFNYRYFLFELVIFTHKFPELFIK